MLESKGMRKNAFFAIIIMLFLCSGCATLHKKTAQLECGLTMDKVIALWGQPKDTIKVGLTPNNYSVEVWEYSRKGVPAVKKDEDAVLIFVDGELYQWAINDPEFVFKTLVELGVLQPEESEPGLIEYQRSLQKSAEEAVQTQRTLEIIRAYEQFKNTQMQIQTMQQLQTIRQQQIIPPPQPPVQPPVRQQQRQ